MWVKDTPENRSLAAVAERGVKAATGVNLAMRACWYGGAVGLCLLSVGGLLAGAGLGAQKFEEGYASIIATRESAERAREIAERAARTTAAMMAQERDEFHAMLAAERDELVAKIAATKLQAEVTVNGDLGIKKGQLVGLPPDTTIHLDPNATVRAVGVVPPSTLRFDPNWTIPAIGQDGPRAPVFEPPPQLRAVRNAMPASARRSAQAEPLTCKGNLP